MQMHYTGKIAGGRAAFDGTHAADGVWYFHKGGAWRVSGTPTYAELAGAINEPIHVCGADVYLGGDMPRACGTICSDDPPAGLSSITVWPDGSSVYFAEPDQRFGSLNIAVSMVGVLVLACFLGLSSVITATAARKGASVRIWYGGVLKDVAFVLAGSALWAIMEEAPHPGATVPSTQVHAVHFVTVSVASAIVVGAFNEGRVLSLSPPHDCMLPFALIGRAAFEVICLLAIAVVSPIMPAVAFAATVQLSIGTAIAGIVCRDVAAAAAGVAGDLLLLSGLGSAIALAVPFCVDMAAVPVGTELAIATALMVNVGVAAVVATRGWH
jgi:hypothetical protein